MKKKTFLFAALLLTPALYAQAQGPFFTREQALDVFTRFNPAVLDKAQQDKEYKAILDLFLDNFHREVTPANETELIAAVRNFDTSIRLHILKKLYREKWIYAQVAGESVDPVRRTFAQEVSKEMVHIWAVSVQLNQYRLNVAQEKLAQLRKEVFSPEREAQKKSLHKEIDSIKTQIKVLTQKSGEYITAITEDYVASVERDLEANFFSVKQAVAENTFQQARATSNLQAKSKHKKPVAQ